MRFSSLLLRAETLGYFARTAMPPDCHRDQCHEYHSSFTAIKSLEYPNQRNHAGLLPDEMRRLKALEDENGRLKRIVADLTLDREMLQDVIRRKL
jgi:hypothetical protein